MSTAVDIFGSGRKSSNHQTRPLPLIVTEVVKEFRRFTGSLAPMTEDTNARPASEARIVGAGAPLSKAIILTLNPHKDALSLRSSNGQGRKGESL